MCGVVMYDMRRDCDYKCNIALCVCVCMCCTPMQHPPLSLAMASPPASVDASVYLPPALREGSVGWYPESGKVWEQYGIPKYVI
jgi:hypothetical protein